MKVRRSCREGSVNSGVPGSKDSPDLSPGACCVRRQLLHQTWLLGSRSLGSYVLLFSCILALTGCIVPCTTKRTGVYTGSVVDDSSSQPVRGARVRIACVPGRNAATDRNGHFRVGPVRLLHCIVLLGGDGGPDLTGNSRYGIPDTVFLEFSHPRHQFLRLDCGPPRMNWSNGRLEPIDVGEVRLKALDASRD